VFHHQFVWFNILGKLSPPVRKRKKAAQLLAIL
jgi:hypothetical protein